MKIEAFKKTKLPDRPGVYFFQKGKSIIYIGKATSLKDRVKSYFGKDLIQTRGPVLVDMVFQAEKIKYQVTDSVLEALILEAELIKKYQPKYNTKEKSDKSFNYVCITKEKLPKVIIIRGRQLEMQKNFPALPAGGLRHGRNFPTSFTAKFGPFTSGTQLREALKIIRRIFPFLDEKSKNYMEFYRQINLVPDINDKQIYLQNINNIKLFFQGKKREIVRNLKKEMKIYSQTREFEKAGEIKRQLFAIQHINDVALLKQEKIVDENSFRIEAYDIAHMGGKNMVGVMTVIEDGEVQKNEYKKFKIRTQSDANDIGALKEVLERRLAHTEWKYPNLIVMDGGVAQINVAGKVLKNLKLKIPIVSVLKDEKHKPKAIMGDEQSALKYKRDIILSNNEAHRFAIAYHKNMRNKNFLL